jgi:hypothetical protein
MKRVFDWWFENRETGEITIAQFPNLSLGIFIAAWLAQVIFEPTGLAGATLSATSHGALIWWSADELIRGVNPWRRTLGAAMLTWQVVGLVTR